MIRCSLDTNIVSDLVRNPQGQAAEQVRSVGEAQVCASIIVAAELRNAAAKRGSPRLARQLEAVLDVIEVPPLGPPADTAYGEIRTRLEETGRPIGGNDLLIASQAVVLGYTIVTDDETEFARIEGLRYENWLRRLCQIATRTATISIAQLSAQCVAPFAPAVLGSPL